MKQSPSEQVAVGIENVVKIYGEGAAAVPALPVWALIALAGALFATAVLLVRRRFAQ